MIMLDSSLEHSGEINGVKIENLFNLPGDQLAQLLFWLVKTCPRRDTLNEILYYLAVKTAK